MRHGSVCEISPEQTTQRLPAVADQIKLNMAKASNWLSSEQGRRQGKKKVDLGMGNAIGSPKMHD